MNRAGTNRVVRRIAPRTRALGVVVHQGRRSGRTYETPVSVFPTDEGFRVPLPYGADTEWVRNVLTAEGCRLKTGRREVSLVEPRVVRDPTRRDVRPFERRMLGLLKVTDFLDLTTSPPGPTTGS